jgi:large subunit ribosomal protein L22
MNAKKTSKAKSKSETVATPIVATASLNGVRISAQKARLVVNLIRGKGVEDALTTLRFLPKKGARLTEKLIISALNNAREQKGANVDKLFIAKAFVNEGATLKRMIPRAQGRGTAILKRSSHITVQLGER